MDEGMGDVGAAPPAGGRGKALRIVPVVALLDRCVGLLGAAPFGKGTETGGCGGVCCWECGAVGMMGTPCCRCCCCICAILQASYAEGGVGVVAEGVVSDGALGAPLMTGVGSGERDRGGGVGAGPMVLCLLGAVL